MHIYTHRWMAMGLLQSPNTMGVPLVTTCLLLIIKSWQAL